MKKFFALVLAVAMVMSMGAVSFAADWGTVAGISSALDYDADTNKIRDTGIRYGDTVLFALGETLPGGTDVAMSEYDQVEKLKVKAKFEMGEDLVESISIVKKKVDLNESASAYTPAAGDYYYFIGMKIASKKTISDADIIGTFTLKRKEVKEKIAGVDTVIYNEIDDEELDFEVNVFYGPNDYINSGDTFIIDGDTVLDYDTHYALKFDYDDEVELSFGRAKGGENEGTFTVDVSGQSKLYLYFDTKLDEAIAEANPGVKMFALNFTGLNSPVKFNRTGEFAYEMEDGVAAYKVVDGKLVAIPGCEYDSSDETFYFQTRALENYIFADAELVNPVVEAPVVEAPVEVTNPSTGA